MLLVNKRSTQVKVLFTSQEMVPPSFILTKNLWNLIKLKLNLIWLDGQLHGDVNKRNLKLLVKERLKEERSAKNSEVSLVFLKPISEKLDPNSPLEKAKPRKKNQRKRETRNTFKEETNKLFLSPTKVQEDDSWYCYLHYSP